MKCSNCGWESRDVEKIYIAEWGRAEPLCEECIFEIASSLLKNLSKSQNKSRGTKK